MPTKDVANVASFQSLGQSMCSASTGLSRLQWPASSFEFNLDSFREVRLGTASQPSLSFPRALCPPVVGPACPQSRGQIVAEPSLELSSPPPPTCFSAHCSARQHGAAHIWATEE